MCQNFFMFFRAQHAVPIQMKFLNVKVLDFKGVFADEVPSFFDIVAHQDTEKPVGFAGIFEFTFKSVRRAGSIVVSQSWSEFISPRPLNRLISMPLPPI